MRLLLGLGWVLGLFACVAGGYLIAETRPFDDAQLDLAVMFAPALAWLLLGFLMSSRLHGPSTLLGAMPAPKNERAELLQALKDHGLAGRRGRYRVPLYVLTGPPGMGKSSLLDRSGIAFAAPVEIAGSTWWIADKLICVEASTASETEALSALLKSWRPALPLNGVILAVSCADLTIADKVERRDIASVLARWLRQFEKTVGARLPVYLMLTKLDLTPGFLEFFDSLEQADRRQPWGFTLPLIARPTATQAEEVAKAMQAGFRRLVEAVKVRLIECLSRETDPLRCGRIQAVGAQIATFEPLISATLGPSLEEKSQRRGVQLRGIYLTSARQESLTIDVLLPELAGRFALPRSGTLPPDLDTDEAEQGYFIAGALQKGILPEAGLVNRERPWRRRHRLHMAAALAVAALALGLGTIAGLQYRDGVRAATLVDERAPALARSLKRTPAPDLPTILASLDDLQTLRRDLRDPDTVPLIWPNAVLHERAKNTYRRALVNMVAPHLTVALESDLGDDRDLAALHTAVTAAGPVKSDPAAFQAWLARHAAVFTDVVREGFIRHGRNVYEQGIALAVDPLYVETATKLIALKEGPK